MINAYVEFLITIGINVFIFFASIFLIDLLDIVNIIYINY